MEMVAHNPAAAKRVGVSQSVGRDFVHADEMRKAKALRKPRAYPAGDSSSGIGGM